ncbi:BamA/TamA family outer membrane protein [Adhaeribacter pallidiroseus]|uniref:Bacterial surface antigen (D15) domain-containing protein n=1 Tax=Adhaeribacter pallidiroseus TaxID=2072847 RepID=A0A369QH23_9BACT|nr:hypothetical protein [Adhaeribacter pallidiroseus]RDC61588.1 hypothetical protein AHMF7616_00167 [Adhaeribacter pallidiroseus]
MYKAGACLFYLLLISFTGWAQREVNVSINTPIGKDREVLRKYVYPARFPDSLAARQGMRSLMQQLQHDGYLTASIDTFYFKTGVLYSQFFIGERYQWARLRNGNVGNSLLAQAGYKEKLYTGKPFLPAEWAKLQEAVLTQAENNGYPFASVRLDSIEIRDNQIDAAVLVEKGPLIVFDSLQISGTTKTSRRFLSRYLQIYPGQLYDQQKNKNITRLLKQLPYLEVTQPPLLQFGRNQVRLYLFLNDKEANQFDGIVGFLPDPQGKEQKLLVTGELNLDIRNVKGSGKALGLHWRKVQRGSQLLNASYSHPNLFGSPLELGFTFNLYKQDTAFITLKPRLQFGFNTFKAGKVTLFTEFQNSRLLLSPVGLQEKRDSIPIADFTYNAYGWEYLRQTLDDLYFPRQGYQLGGQIAIGNKTIKRNISREASYYDTIRLKTTQVSMSLHGEHYFKLNRTSVVLTRLRGEALINPQLFYNDLFRLGGLTTLRGFPEYTFYASRYAIGTLEYRLFTGQDSYVLLFYDQGYYRRSIGKDRVQEYPIGLGTGISFSTGAGIFQFIYSVGQSKALNQPIGLNYSRIHFGLTSRF